MATTPLRIGELAERTGISVRTLHHYEAIGLLVPGHRTEAGHRLYGRDEIARLQLILSLKHLGFSLSQISDFLAGRVDAKQIVTDHLGALKQRIAAQRNLYQLLEGLAARYDLADSEEFLTAIKELTMFEKYYTPEQLEALRQRGEQLGEEHVRAVEAEWPRLIAAVRAEMDNETDPNDARVQALARLWQQLVEEFTGGDPGITQSLKNFYQNESDVAARMSLDGGIFDYVRRALSREP